MRRGMERDPKRMFKVIVTGGIALVSVGSLVALASCGSDASSGSSIGMPQEGANLDGGNGPITRPSDSGHDSPNDAAGDAFEPYDAGDAGDADASFPPII